MAPIKLAHALVKDGQFDRAVTTLQEAIAAAPWRADLRMHLGLLHGSIDDYEAAVEALSEAARLAPLDADVHMHLGLALGAMNLYYVLQIVHQDIAGMRLDYQFPIGVAATTYMVASVWDGIANFVAVILVDRRTARFATGQS